jgi:hypothetical protein
MYQPYALFELQVCFRLQIHITANKYNWKKQAFYHIKFLYWTNSSSQTDFVGHVLGLTTNVKMLWEIFKIFEPPAIKSPLSCHSGHISRCPIIFFYKNFFSTNKHLKCWVNVRHLDFVAAVLVDQTQPISIMWITWIYINLIVAEIGSEYIK